MSFSFFRRTLGALALLVLALGGAARAAQSTPSPSPTALPEIAHVVTADRRDEPISKTSRPTYVMDRASIVACGAQTVAEALANVPGVQILSYGAFGAQANYGLVGSTSEQTLILLDGEPIAVASSGTIDLGTFPTIGVSRIEVVESGASTLYGTSAVGGVINIITGIPRGTYLALSTGSLGDRDAGAEVGVGKFGLAFDRHVASNVYAFPSVDGLPGGVRQNADAQQSAARVSYASTLGAWNFGGSAGDDAIATGVPGAVPAPNGFDSLTPNARQHISRGDLRLNLAHDGANSTFSVTAAASRQNLAYADPGPEFAVPGFGDESDIYDARTQLSLREEVTTARTTLVSGVDLSRENSLLDLGPAAAPVPSAPPVPPQVSAALSQSAAYTEFETGLGSATTLNLGLRGEHNSPYGSILAPSLGAVLNAKHVRFAANADETYRAPSIEELYYPQFGYPGLQPEKLRTIDMTASTDAVLGGASFGFFDRYANDLIYDTPTSPANIQLASLRGFVTTVRTRPATGGIVTSLSITNLFRAVDLTPQNFGDRLPYEPAFQVTLQMQRPVSLTRLGFGLDFRSTGGHFEPYAPSLVNGFSDVDAYIRAHISPQLVLSLRGTNIGDEGYEGVYGYPAPGRRLEVEVATQ